MVRIPPLPPAEAGTPWSIHEIPWSPHEELNFFNSVIEILWDRYPTGTDILQDRQTIVGYGHDTYAEAYTHESVFVGDVVGQLQLVERDDLAHPLFSGERRVRVDVHALRHLRIGLAGHHPARVVELVAAVVHGDDVDEHDVLGSLVEARHFDFERRKHSPA